VMPSLAHSILTLVCRLAIRSRVSRLIGSWFVRSRFWNPHG